MMAKYRKKPVVIEAVQWTGHNWDEIDTFCSHASKAGNYSTTGDLVIVTMEGEMLARPSWWVIKGVQGEFYPCEPDIFEATYELVEE